MTRTKRNAFIISAAAVALVLAIVFLSLGLTIWRPKTTEEWLKDFSAALVMQQDQSNRKAEKSIVIIENETEVARYYQLIEVHTQNGRPVAHLIAEEKFPSLGTTEFDIYDEYYFYDGTMYMSRNNGGEVSGANFSSTWETFWEVAYENMGKNAYSLDQEAFESIDITHDGDIHTLNVIIDEDKKDKFFVETDGVNDMRGISMTIRMDDVLTLVSFQLSYMFQNTQSVTIEIKSDEPTEIIINNIVV